LAFQYATVHAIALLVWLVGGADVGDFWPRWVFLVTLIMVMRRVFGHGHRGHRRLPPETLRSEGPPVLLAALRIGRRLAV
jgi:hypothetical protein